jgi:DNA repair photolyase
VAAFFPIFHTEARGILSKTSGFIAQAGFTHSLTPARNCTFGCSYCYVPTMGIYGGLKPEDWQKWGQFTVFKVNARDLLEKQVRPGQIIYCSPLVDPYQPAEECERMMPLLLEVLIARPPRVFVLQTRGPLITRDLALLARLAEKTILRVSFTLTTSDDEIHRLYEPRCAPLTERLLAMEALRSAGIDCYATLAPLLPGNLEHLIAEAARVTDRDLIADPFHIRATKKCGATTRDAAQRIALRREHDSYFDPQFQAELCERARAIAAAHGRRFGVGPEGFSWLAQTSLNGSASSVSTPALAGAIG